MTWLVRNFNSGEVKTSSWSPSFEPSLVKSCKDSNKPIHSCVNALFEVLMVDQSGKRDVSSHDNSRDRPEPSVEKHYGQQGWLV